MVSMYERLIVSLLIAFLPLAAVSEMNATETNSTASKTQPNVLFIAIDDLRPALRCFGDQTAVTPHIDQLARRGTCFTRAYCQLAVCCPSRLSLLTGRRPDVIQVWDLKTHFREEMPDIVTLPQHFKNNGYQTQSIGKVLHGSGKPSKDPPSWSIDPVYDFVRDPQVRYASPENLKGTGLKRAASESANVPDSTYIDGIVCNAAIEALGKLKADATPNDDNQKEARPFFLAVGFRKPHLPFCAPRKYWDLYDRDQIPMPVSNQSPEGAPELAIRSWKELEGYTDIPNDGQINDEKVRELRHGYYACVSYVDALVGRLLAELRRLELEENTIVVLWGDHGFHLGEQGLWAKANNYELSTRVPLIVSVPNQQTVGVKCDEIVELIDLFPTLSDVAQLTQEQPLDGVSFRPLLESPLREWKPAAYSQYPRAFESNRHRKHGDIMGYAIRTKRYRYVEWRVWESKEIVARELYDHETDSAEMKNIVDSPGNSKLVETLSQQLLSHQ